MQCSIQKVHSTLLFYILALWTTLCSLDRSIILLPTRESLPDTGRLPCARGTRQRLFSPRQNVCRVLLTANYTRQTNIGKGHLCRVFFFAHSAKVLPCVKTSTRQTFSENKKKSVGPTRPLPHAGTSSSPPSERPLRCRRGPRPVARASSAAGVAAAAPARGVLPLPHTRWPAPWPPPATGQRRCCHPLAVAATAIRPLSLLPPSACCRCCRHPPTLARRRGPADKPPPDLSSSSCWLLLELPKVKLVAHYFRILT